MKTKTITKKVFTYFFCQKSAIKTITITKKVFHFFCQKSQNCSPWHGGQEREDRGRPARRHTHSGNHEGGGGLPEHHLSREEVFAEGRYSK
jgi:hypothetical protein